MQGEGEREREREGERTRAANLIYVEFTSDAKCKMCSRAGGSGAGGRRHEAAVIRQRNLEQILRSRGQGKARQAALIQHFDKLNVSRQPKQQLE